jgi:hypothetical protein
VHASSDCDDRTLHIKHTSHELQPREGARALLLAHASDALTLEMNMVSSMQHSLTNSHTT